MLEDRTKRKEDAEKREKQKRETERTDGQEWMAGNTNEKLTHGDWSEEKACVIGSELVVK